MGYYKAMDTKVERAARGRVCEGLQGQVVEIGFGSGLNAVYYPSAVSKVLAIEPSQVSMRLSFGPEARSISSNTVTPPTSASRVGSGVSNR